MEVGKYDSSCNIHIFEKSTGSLTNIMNDPGLTPDHDYFQNYIK